MHHFVIKFSKFSSPQAARGYWPPIIKILRTFLAAHELDSAPVRELDFANYGVNGRTYVCIHVLRTNRAVTVLVSLQPMNTNYTCCDASGCDQ